MVRPLLAKLGDAVEECISGGGGLVVAVLPTGYGKTSFVRLQLLPRVAKGLRILHVLPLRAIVKQTAEQSLDIASKLGIADAIGFQAGIEVDDVDKTPFLAKSYTVATLDSIIMNFFGVPVAELLRTAWHSDAAYALARSFHLLVLDEYHLMVSGDAEQDETTVELVAKQVVAVGSLVASYLKRGRCVTLLTATLPPQLLELVLDFARETFGVKTRRAWLIAFGGPGHPYVQRLVESLRARVESLNTVYGDDKDFRRSRCGRVTTFIVDARMLRTTFNGVEIELGDLAAVRELLGNLWDNARRVFLAFNSWRRAYTAFKLFAGRLGCEKSVLLTGKMPAIDREPALSVLAERVEGKLCLFATQVVEAGVDVSFDLLISEAAPAPQLVQRAGRVARHEKPDPKRHGVVVLTAKGRVEPFVRGVYSVEETEATVKELNKLKNGNGVFDWRCPVGSGATEDVWSLVLHVDKRVEQLRSNILNRFPTLYNSLKPLLTFTMTPDKALMKLDEVVKGSLVRHSALIPLIPWERLREVVNVEQTHICKGFIDAVGEDERRLLLRSTIGVDTAFLNTYTAFLMSCNGSGVVAAALVPSNTGYQLVLAPTRIEVERLIDRPLTMLRHVKETLQKRLRALLNSHSIERMLILGLVSNPNVYEPGLGLKPIPRR